MSDETRDAVAKIDELYKKLDALADQLKQELVAKKKSGQLSEEQLKKGLETLLAMRNKINTLLYEKATIQMDQIEVNLDKFEGLSEKIAEATEKIKKTQEIVQAVVAGLVAVSKIVEAVFTPTPQKIGEAAGSVSDFVESIC